MFGNLDALRGPRLTLRTFDQKDAPALFEAIEASRRELRPWVSWERSTRKVADARTFLLHASREQRAGILAVFAVIERATGEIVGAAGLHSIDWGNGNCELGYWVRSDRTGRGYATELTILLCRFAMKTLGMVRVQVAIATRNQRSRRIMERLRIPFEGIARNAGKVGIRIHHHRIYGLTEQDFRRLWPQWRARLTANRKRSAR